MGLLKSRHRFLKSVAAFPDTMRYLFVSRRRDEYSNPSGSLLNPGACAGASEHGPHHHADVSSLVGPARTRTVALQLGGSGVLRPKVRRRSGLSAPHPTLGNP